MRSDDANARGRLSTNDGDRRGAASSDAALRRIAEALEHLRYGSVTVIVQDGVVVQIERTEKTRLIR